MTDGSFATHPPIARLAVFALLGWLACGQGPEIDSDARALDRACSGNACTVSGNTEATPVVAPGSTGFRLGPGPSEVAIPLAAFGTFQAQTEAQHTSFTDWRIHVLASGHGTFYARLNTSTDSARFDVPTTSSGDWVSVAEGNTYVGNPDAGAAPTLPTSLVLGVTDDSIVDIGDLQFVALDTDPGCE
jgi:hypothetical protein